MVKAIQLCMLLNSDQSESLLHLPPMNLNGDSDRGVCATKNTPV